MKRTIGPSRFIGGLVVVVVLSAALATVILQATAFAEGNPAQDQYGDEPTQSEPSSATPPSDSPSSTAPSDSSSTTPPSETPSTPNLKEWHPPTGNPGDEAGQTLNPSQGQNSGGQQNTDESQPGGPGKSSQEQQQQNPKEGLPDKGTQPADSAGKVIVDVIPQPTGDPPKSGFNCEQAKTWWTDSSGAVWAQWAGWCWNENTGWLPWKGATFGPFTTENLPYLAPETSGLSQAEIEALRKYLPGGLDAKELEALRGDLQPNGGADSGAGTTPKAVWDTRVPRLLSWVPPLLNTSYEFRKTVRQTVGGYEQQCGASLASKITPKEMMIGPVLKIIRILGSRNPIDLGIGFIGLTTPVPSSCFEMVVNWMAPGQLEALNQCQEVYDLPTCLGWRSSPVYRDGTPVVP